MVIAVRTEHGPDGIEVVKEADTEDDRVRLADEAAVLQRAAHPGVVEVLESSDSVLRLRHCGSPLSRLGPLAPDHAAAIVRAVAEIVDALHRQGIVHRRLDADHIVVSERGRPHLVGFGEAGDADPTEIADDVAALGALLDRLLDDGSDALWSPDHRGVRAATRRKRSMAAFRSATSAAQRADSGQRPSAHQFATAISEALPGLTLPTPPGVDSDDPGVEGFAEIPHDIDPTDDLGWTDFDLSYLAVDDEVADDGQIERNPAAPRDPYAVLESLASPEPDAPAPVTEEPDPVPDEVAAEEETQSPVADPQEPDPIIEALRAAMGTETAMDPDPVPDWDRMFEPEPEPKPDAPDDELADLVTPSPPPEAATTRELRPPSIQIRPGDADPTPEDRRGLSRRALVTVAAVVLVAGAVAGSVIARAIDPFGDESAAATPDSAPRDTTEATDDARPTPPPISDGCPPVDLAGPDTDADGCPDAVTLDGRIAMVGEAEVELGQDGDLVAIADADCDGIATPVVLRPDTGEVFDFPGWSLDEAIEVTATTVIDDAESITAGPDACPEVVVTDAAGDAFVVAP